jgi:hypothetical protein
MTGQDYVNDEIMNIRYTIPHVSDSIKSRYSFRYHELPVFGVGPYGFPIVNCDSYIDLSLLNGISDEFYANLNQSKHRLHKMMPFGLVPEHLNNQKCLDSYLINLDKYDSNHTLSLFGDHNTHYHDYKEHACDYFKLNKPWKDVLHIRKLSTFFEKNNPGTWNDVAHNFPKLCDFIESLPFKHVGYAMIMINNPGSRLDIHRDIWMQNHSAHHINIAIDFKPRSVFIYDAITDTKYYKTENSLSYFFNECDLHGADAVDDSRLTLRVDGQFTDNFARAVGLEGGKTFDWCYDRPTDFIKQNGGVKVYKETDI